MSDSTSHQRNTSLPSVADMLSRQSGCQIGVAMVDRIQNPAMLGDCDGRSARQRERRRSESSRRIMKLLDHLQEHCVVRTLG